MLLNKYDSSAIEVLQGLDPVRKRPGMYTDTAHPTHLAQEVIDNSVDEVIAGFASQITATLHTDGSFSVKDNGRGIPVDVHQEEGLPGVEVIMTRLHAGAKFSTKNYRHSGGLHGVGVSVVNALSRTLIVQIKRGGIRYEIEFANGDLRKPLTEASKVRKLDTGTSVRFWPDGVYFDSLQFNVKKIKKLLLAKAVLCAGLELHFVDEIDPTNSESWKVEEGLSQYLLDRMNGSEVIPEMPITVHSESENYQVDCAVIWTADASDAVSESYVNLIPTELGGSHVSGFRSGVTEALREFCEFRNLVPKGMRLTPEDVCKQCSYILSVRMDNPQFSGQTKDRLSSRQTAKLLASTTKNAFSLWLNNHVPLAEKITSLSLENARQRLKSSRQVKRKKILIGPALPGKLADCTSDDVEFTELFLVEGDSAGGSAKQARNRETQAILPLRGKILNTWEISSSEVLASKEAHSIAVALGVDPGSPDIDSLRYGKVCILADADSDGAHIATLLCALFVKHFKSLVKAGRVYVAMPPLFRIDVAKNVYYALDEHELNQIRSKIKLRKPNAKISVQRFKGLGEMNPSQLKETTMSPSTRKLIRLTIDNPNSVTDTLNMLLAKKSVAARKAWLTRVGNQAQI